MNENNPASVYESSLRQHSSLLTTLQKRRSYYGWARLVLVLTTVAFTYLLLTTGEILGGWAVIFCGTVAFLLLLNRDVANNTSIANTKLLIGINEEELKILQYQFKHRENGAVYLKPLHPYADDLDILGASSLYQYMNRCVTGQGRALLAANLLEALPPLSLGARQEAAKEAAPMVAWRQQFAAYAQKTPISIATQERVLDWLVHDNSAFESKRWTLLVPVYSVITLVSALAAALDFIPTSIFSFLFFIYFITGSLLGKKAVHLHSKLTRIVPEMSALTHLLKSFEEQQFLSGHLQWLQQQGKPDTGPAWLQLRSLKAILGRFDLRLNAFLFIFLNSFLLWDVRQARSLNAWKKTNRSLVGHWFAAIAETEVIISIATLHFNQPAWAFPRVAKTYCKLEGTKIGHPLIYEQVRVSSDFSISGSGVIALVTGSNMAGKSTFLRSLGVNLVLAQMGAPVCAANFYFSPMQLMSSMRIADDLSENTSTFYAELKKLKSIIEAVSTKAPLFILLDEILRGTNSQDRHVGSRALIGQLIRDNTVAVLATHDLSLAEWSGVCERSIENYHFDVQVANEEELYFDYKLKKGVCQSLNAAILMRKIGIEM